VGDAHRTLVRAGWVEGAWWGWEEEEEVVVEEEEEKECKEEKKTPRLLALYVFNMGHGGLGPDRYIRKGKAGREKVG
jgi:hypothetical protein